MANKKRRKEVRETAVYAATARRRHQEQKQGELRRREEAWAVAQQAARLLQQEFGAVQVLVFGSLAHKLWFTATSDIDLAAKGIHPQDYFSAVARLQDISPHFHIDLVNLDCCTTGQQVLIDAEGHPL